MGKRLRVLAVCAVATSGALASAAPSHARSDTYMGYTECTRGCNGGYTAYLAGDETGEQFTAVTASPSTVAFSQASGLMLTELTNPCLPTGLSSARCDANLIFEPVEAIGAINQAGRYLPGSGRTMSLVWISGNGGDDVIDARGVSSRITVDCGPGNDHAMVRADLAFTTGCETVSPS